MLEKAIRIGELLVTQKAECGHGNWLPWIKANLDFSEQTTSRIGEGVLHVVKNTMRVGAHCRDRRVGLFLCAHTRLFAY
jgi:hypothetical protein